MANGDVSVMDFDYSLIEGSVVTAVLGNGKSVSRNGVVQFDAIAVIVSGGKILNISVDVDTDEVEVMLSDAIADERAFDPVGELGFVVGRELGWCWRAENYLGYSDAFLLSFSGISPDVLFLGVASSISILNISPVRPVL